MSVYQSEHAEHLIACFDSIEKQTLSPTEIVLVEDGPLTPQLYEAIENEAKRFPCLKRVVLEKNQGLGIALSKGLQACSFDIVARMDTDDICTPNRFEAQMSYLQEHDEIDVLGAWITEFDHDPSNVISVRNLPENHDDIYRFGQKRNPINHPVVMFRKHAIQEAGGYLPLPLFEDYYLWARMLKKGYRFHNLPLSLLLFRRSPEMIRRRGGFSYAQNEIHLQKKLYEIGYISRIRMIKNVLIRYGVRIVPNYVRGFIYKNLLRTIPQKHLK